jgi:C-terminal processing protease CtpA/Prc
MRYKFAFVASFLFATLTAGSIMAQDVPPAEIVNEEGGPLLITGQMTYTDPLFTAGVGEPLIILEDQAGFVERNESFLMSPESQVMGQITSDFYTSPVSYSIALPIEPQATLKDVDHDGESDTGVMIYAVAYWTNVFGPAFLEERDLFGGGWSTGYASTHISPNPNAKGEVIGGKYLIYALDDQQGFPSGFGEDGLLFTDDDPIVSIPQGYSVVNMDAEPFTFDRSREVVVNTVEDKETATDNFSNMSYIEAFDAMVEKFRTDYAFTELKNLDWDAISAEFRPQFEEAEANADPVAYVRALQHFTWVIPDGHVSSSAFINDDFSRDTDGSLGIAIRELDDGRVIVSYLFDGGPAAEAGVELRAEILAINGQPVGDAISAAVPYSSPFSTDHAKRLQQLRYAVRFPMGTQIELTFKNPGDNDSQTVTLDTIDERDSWTFSFNAIGTNAGQTGFELPLEYRLLDSGLGYVKIYSFFDNERLTVDLWERLIQDLNQQNVPGLIIDMRQNGGGNGFLAAQMAAYFFDEPHELYKFGTYDRELGEFYFDPNPRFRFYLPPEDKRYNGDIAVLVGPACASACEFFSYDMTIDDRAAIVGQYPTAGLGGGIEQFFMPEGQVVQLPVSRPIDQDGNIVIEGQGIVPTVKVPVNEETLFTEVDPVLDAAVKYLTE